MRKILKFENFSKRDKVVYVKRDIANLAQIIFANPTIIKTYIDKKIISTEEAFATLDYLNSFNIKQCLCCRCFDDYMFSKEGLSNISELQPLIEMAQYELKVRYNQ